MKLRESIQFIRSIVALLLPLINLNDVSRRPEYWSRLSNSRGVFTTFFYDPDIRPSCHIKMRFVVQRLISTII